MTLKGKNSTGENVRVVFPTWQLLVITGTMFASALGFVLRVEIRMSAITKHIEEEPIFKADVRLLKDKVDNNYLILTGNIDKLRENTIHAFSDNGLKTDKLY